MDVPRSHLRVPFDGTGTEPLHADDSDKSVRH
jgi:hypothetical protein